MRVAHKRWTIYFSEITFFPVHRYEADYNRALRRGGMHNPCFKEILRWGHPSTVMAVERGEKGESQTFNIALLIVAKTPRISKELYVANNLCLWFIWQRVIHSTKSSATHRRLWSDTCVIYLHEYTNMTRINVRLDEWFIYVRDLSARIPHRSMNAYYTMQQNVNVRNKPRLIKSLKRIISRANDDSRHSRYIASKMQ